jgi:hypothetical protein
VRKTVARLAYDAFMLRVENELVNLGRGGSNLKEEINDFFTDLQRVMNSHRKVTINHGKVWRDVGKYIDQKIELAHSYEDDERITKYRYFQEVYFDVDNEFLKRDELSEDTVIAKIG